MQTLTAVVIAVMTLVGGEEVEITMPSLAECQANVDWLSVGLPVELVDEGGHVEPISRLECRIDMVNAPDLEV